MKIENVELLVTDRQRKFFESYLIGNQITQLTIPPTFHGFFLTTKKSKYCIDCRNEWYDLAKWRNAIYSNKEVQKYYRFKK